MSDQDLIGRTLGQYKIVEPIGAGGMATIFKAYQASIDRYVAVKVLPQRFAGEADFVKRFMREAKAIASLEHPHIVPVYDFGTADDLPYLVMRYVEGGALARRMNQPIPVAKTVEIISNIALALDYAHSQGVIHRDVKPGIILLDQHGEALLTDFGIAKVADELDSTQLTQVGNIMGTPNYIAPEQASGLPADARSDIYSLGVILYELLTGRPPYQGATPLATVLMHINDPLPPPRSINPRLEKGLEYVLLTALDKDPAHRYQRAGDMAHALRMSWQAIEKRGEVAEGRKTTVFAAPDAPETLLSPPPAPTKLWLRSIKGLLLVIGLLLLGGAIALFQLAPQNRLPDTDIAATTLTADSADVSDASDQTDQVIQTPERTETPAAATPSPEPTKPPPTLTPETLLGGTILFREQFSANERNWFTLELDDGFGPLSVKLINGRYRLSRQATETVFDWQELPEVEFDNFVLSVEASPSSETAFSYGLIFRSNANNEFYTFEVSNRGFFQVRLRTVDGWRVLVAETPLAAIIPNELNQLVVKADGPALSFFINGQAAAAIEDQSNAAGRIGLFLSVEEGTQGTVEFDELTVRQIVEDFS